MAPKRKMENVTKPEPVTWVHPVTYCTQVTHLQMPSSRLTLSSVKCICTGTNVSHWKHNALFTNTPQAFLTDLWGNVYGNIDTSQHLHPIPTTLNSHHSNQCTLKSQPKTRKISMTYCLKNNVFQKMNSTLFR